MQIVLTCQILAEMGFPLTKDYVEVVVRDYLSGQEGRSGAFESTGVPGDRGGRVFYLCGQHWCNENHSTCQSREPNVQHKR